MNMEAIRWLCFTLIVLAGNDTWAGMSQLPKEFAQIDWQTTRDTFGKMEPYKHCFKKPGASPRLAGYENTKRYCFTKEKLNLVVIDFAAGARAAKSPGNESDRKELYRDLTRLLKDKYGPADAPDRIIKTYGGIAWLEGDTVVHLTNVNGMVSLTLTWVDDPFLKRMTSAGAASPKVRKAYLRIWQETKNWDRMLAAFDDWFKKNGSVYEGYSVQEDGSLVLRQKDGPLEFIRIQGLPRRDDAAMLKKRAVREEARRVHTENEVRYAQLIEPVLGIMEKHIESQAWSRGPERICRFTECMKIKDERGMPLMANNKACKEMCAAKVQASCAKILSEVRSHITQHGPELRQRVKTIGPAYGPAMRAISQVRKRCSKLERWCGDQGQETVRIFNSVLRQQAP